MDYLFYNFRLHSLLCEIVLVSVLSPSQIISELEVPSQRPAAIIATVSVLCSLIILLIICGILYKVSLSPICLTDEVVGLYQRLLQPQD